MILFAGLNYVGEVGRLQEKNGIDLGQHAKDTTIVRSKEGVDLKRLVVFAFLWSPRLFGPMSILSSMKRLLCHRQPLPLSPPRFATPEVRFIGDVLPISEMCKVTHKPFAFFLTYMYIIGHDPIPYVSSIRRKIRFSDLPDRVSSPLGGKGRVPRAVLPPSISIFADT